MIGSKLVDVYRELIAVAMGREPADLLVENCSVVDVITGDVFEGCIAVKKDRIALVGERVRARKVIDAKGRYAVPGFVDAHAHPDYYLTLPEFADLSVKHGTTTLFAEPDAALNSMGVEGFKLFVKWAKECSARVFVQIPFICPQDPAVEDPNFDISLEELVSAAGDLLVGMGEVVAWSGALNGDDDVLKKVEFAIRREMVVLGHSAGAKRSKLAAYSVLASSCHEAISPEQGIERLRNGMHLMVREGSIRSDISVLDSLGSRVDKSWISVVSDGVEPVDLVEGYMDAVARKIVELGFDPIDALRMVTVDPARYYGKERDIGVLAPPRHADIVFLRSLERFEVDRVLVGGERPKSTRTVESAFSVMRVEKVEKKEIEIGAEGSVRVRVAKMVSETVNREVVRDVEVRKGEVDGLCKAVLVDRFHNRKPVVALLENLELEGAVASTVCFDEYNIVAVGTKDEDIVKAVNELIKLGGGVVYAGDKTLKLKLPFGGVMSSDVEDVVSKLGKLREILREKGMKFENPLNVLHFLTFVTLPELKLSNRGIVRVKDRKVVPLIVE